MISRRATVLAMGLATLQASAQDRFADVTVESQPVADGIFMLTGSGGNIGVMVGDDATFVVDDQFAELAGRIEAAITKLSDVPIGFILNTHWHGDHTGGNEYFANSGAVVVAHENVRKRMSVESFNKLRNTTTPAAPDAARPVVTFSSDITLHLNGKTVEVKHLSAAHTDGDAAVLFVDDNILHAGDLLFNGLYPYIDTSSGGSINGLIAAATDMLDWVDADTKIIPGHGPLANRDDLRAYRDFLTTMRDAIGAMIEQGNTVEEVLAARPTADYDASLNRVGFFTPEQWVTLVYNDLSR